MLPQILIVLRKELIDTLRDRRSAFFTLLGSAISGPLMVLLIFNMLSNQVEKAEQLKLPVLGREHAPALIAFLEAQQARLTTASADFAARLQEGELDVVLEIDSHFAADLDEGRSAKVRLHYDRSRDKARASVARARQLLNAYNQQWGGLRLLARGLAPEVAQPMSIEDVNLATPQQSGSGILFLLAFYGVYAALLSGMASAVDVTAGERERGSLEPLLATPISPLALAAGKWLAVAIFSALVVLLTISGFYLTLNVLPLPNVGIPFLFGGAEWAEFVGILIPLALFFVSVLLLIGIAGRTHKEAQTNASLVMLVVGLLPLIQIFRQGKEPPWLAYLPVTGHYSLLNKVLRGDVMPMNDVIAGVAIPIAGALFCVWLFSRVLRRESSLAGK